MSRFIAVFWTFKLYVLYVAHAVSKHTSRQIESDNYGLEILKYKRILNAIILRVHVLVQVLFSLPYTFLQRYWLCFSLSCLDMNGKVADKFVHMDMKWITMHNFWCLWAINVNSSSGSVICYFAVLWYINVVKLENKLLQNQIPRLWIYFYKTFLSY